MASPTTLPWSALAATAILLLLASPECRAGEIEGAKAAGGPTEVFVQAESNISVLGEMVSGSAKPGSFGYGLRIGFRKNRWDAFVQAEHGLWRDDEGVDSLSIQTMNVGVGVGLSYFERHMRASLAIGPSILLTPSQLDDAGAVGIFLDLRPAGFRWPVGEHVVVELNPLTFAIVMPTMTGIPLLYFTYRTALLLEVMF